MAEIRVHVDRDAVVADPALEPDADGRDLVFGHRAVGALVFLGTLHPHPHPVIASLALYIEAGERPDDPALEDATKARTSGRRRLRSSIV